MKANIEFCLAIMLAVAFWSRGCGPDGARSWPDEPEGTRWLGVFPAYPGAREICSQHVTGNLMHIIWAAYATRDEPEKVGAFYLKSEGEERAERNNAWLTFRHGDKLLSIHRASARDYPDCGKSPDREDKTVLIVSQAIRPK